MFRILALLVTCLVILSPALPCSLCLNQQTAKTLRQEALDAKMILFGTVANPRLDRDGTGGTTDFQITSVIKSHDALGKTKLIEIPRYIPVKDAKNPPQFLVFVDLF